MLPSMGSQSRTRLSDQTDPPFPKLLSNPVVDLGRPLLARQHQQKTVWWWFSRQVLLDSYNLRDCNQLGSPSMGFCRQENQSGLPFPSPGYLPNPGTEPRFPTQQADSLQTELRGKIQQKTELKINLENQSTTTLHSSPSFIQSKDT